MSPSGTTTEVARKASRQRPRNSDRLPERLRLWRCDRAGVDHGRQLVAPQPRLAPVRVLTDAPERVQIENLSERLPQIGTRDELLPDCCADAQVHAEPRGITVDLTAAERCDFEGDRHRLRQLLLIIIDNAVKYNEPVGRVTLSLNPQPDSVEISCANTGKGIPADRLARVFDRFYRGEVAVSDQEEGCGLGLAIAEWIVRAHGGRIDLQSVPHQVTRVRIQLPVHPDRRVNHL
jgi:signal transduction histidine kinase